MKEAQLNPALERNPRVIQARAIAREANSVAELIAGAKTIDTSDFAFTNIIVSGRRGERCPETSPIMLLGKSPAATEIERGKPFQGPAGQILRKAFVQANQDIESFYHGQASPWRPRKENTPNATQVAISRPLLQREIELVAPRRIIALGAKAVDTLFGHHGSMDDDEERQAEWRGIEVVILRNHGFILRNPRLFDSYAAQISRWGY